MEATKILNDEHRVIERVLAVLEKAAGSLEADQGVQADFFLSAAEFIKGFADGCHHRKEEGVLFPAMEAAGVPRQGGPIGVMLAEHEEGRRLTREMGLYRQKYCGCIYSEMERYLGKREATTQKATSNE